MPSRLRRKKGIGYTDIRREGIGVARIRDVYSSINIGGVTLEFISIDRNNLEIEVIKVGTVTIET